MEREITPDLVERLTKELEADPRHRLLQNAVTRNHVDQVALDHQLARSIDRTMSHQLDDWTATNQKQSGRCWMFAGLNLLRVGAAQRLGMKELELSQSYPLFWDKLEKANHWLESVLATADRDVDDRTVAHLLSAPTEDGGQWNMFLALVAKHGLVPQSAMPETVSSSSTRQLNRDLATVLRQAARDLRGAAAGGADAAALAEAKGDVLEVVHRMLCLHLGTPPTSFTWQWRDTDKTFHRDGELTPQEFAQRYVTVPLDDYVCLVHDPRESSPYGRTFTVEHLGNVVGAPPVVYLNVEMDVLKRLAREAIVGGADGQPGEPGEPGEPVWFGCDVEPMREAENGYWDAALFDYDALYGSSTTMTKADRLHHHATAMTHAMLLTGVDVVDGPDGPTARRWRVENSWGTDKADKGFWTMNDSWFGEYVFEIAVRRDALPADLRAALDQEPLVLPAWDPMGALARQG
ncbi:aminopeptidase C [Nocardioides sp. AX2bis]|uniref:aminopeptidase C n=1 Tax=Nocardioides sp. AX2bis TaxID=2653157 RepID=UPI0012F00419|nr:C1 family peptidase [Nocardioides sp. AX2bis]VXB98771.1 Aminopeptidase C [Nocardioides sp. AX2bis]